ncbi:MAG: NAD-dependent epimerase/dehydratase family protein [Myxococcota bacterium]
MTTKSLVTGARGFVGRHLVAALAARGDEVTASDLGPEAPGAGESRYVAADLRDDEAVADLVAGHDVVFHNASVVHTRRTGEDVVWDVNEGGTRRVIAGCRRHGVPRLVYVSSASAVYEGEDIENGDESAPYSRISQAAYADSKIAAEQRVLAANGDALATCAIRPHIVFGPGDTRFLPAILARAKAGRLRVAVGRERKLSDFTYIDNLIDGLLRADTHLQGPAPVASGKAYFVTNGEPMPFWTFVGKVLHHLALPPIAFALPYRFVYALAAVSEKIDELRGRPVGFENGMSRFAIRYMCTHHYFSIARAGNDLGYAPKVDLDEGIRRTCDHLKAEGF